METTSFTEDQFVSRISGFATEDTLSRFMPKKTRKEYTGICPHCGEPCAPYTTCKKFREYNAIGYHVRAMVDEGLIKVVGKKLDGKTKIYQKVPQKHPIDVALRKKAKLQKKARRKNR
jgi:hypothetical protein